MSTQNLQRIFRPAGVAVIGASQRHGSVGDAVMRNLLDADFRRTVIPVNPKHEEIHGLRAYQEVGQLSEPEGQTTYCSVCHQPLITRVSHSIATWNLTDGGRCPRCSSCCAGVFESQPGEWGNRHLPVHIGQPTGDSKRARFAKRTS